jgi:hypothetical protein
METTTLALIAVAVVVLVVLMMVIIGKSSLDGSHQIEIHPAQLKFMEEKEAKYCSGNTKGKGIRCIIDYLREASKEQVQQILAEASQFSEGYTTLSMELYERQIWFLSDHGLKIDQAQQGVERYKAFSKSFRAMLDFAMRMEKEGNTEAIEDIFGNVRCLNC